MQLVIDIDDDTLVQEFLKTTPKDEQKVAFTEMLITYLTNKRKESKNSPIIREGDDEVYGMWADREINVDEFVRELRKGRTFDDYW